MYSVPSVKLLNEYFTKNQKEPFIPQASLQVFWLSIITLLDIAICCLVLLTKTKSREAPANMAARVGFEPTDVCGVAGFQDQFLKPLGHLTIKGWGGTEIPPHSKEKKLSITVS